ncbi:thioredoxin [Terrisporobacter mayombei]|uniref:Thioredoxin n=1 Tax=Terrisporobacter mayombei TaxID=1541 RepID=A0ABY9Q0V1_9FIRM|nr:thioredoxin [Terrisporobacter mayombei]MCC3866986.1 thioredoxin [Terrisporobacter mayombei]WMT81239.1 Thiol:disulfide interchange protein DsbD [Terrisporobacter mayombei]
MAKIIKTNEFANVVKNKKGIVVVDFFATWCGPCKMLSPVYNSLAEEMVDKADFYKVDIDESMELAEKFVVSTVPTVIVFKDGKEMDRLVGFIPKNNLIDKIGLFL